MELIPDFIDAQARAGPSRPTSTRSWRSTCRRPTGSWSTRSRCMRIAADLAGLHAGRGRHPAQGDGQEGPRAHGRAAREVPRRAAKAQRRSTAKAERVWELIEKFAGYGFNKATPPPTGSSRTRRRTSRRTTRWSSWPRCSPPKWTNTDKIVQYMDECRAMGLARRCRPTSTSPRCSFTVAGETIRFGLGAIKNVGADGDRVHRRLPRAAGRLRVARATSARGSTSSSSTGGWWRA